MVPHPGAAVRVVQEVVTPPPTTFRAPFRVVGERIFDRNGVMVAAKLGQYAPHWFPVGWVCFEGPNQAARYEAWRAWWAQAVPQTEDAAEVVRALDEAWGV